MRNKRLAEMEEHFRLNDELSSEDVVKIYVALTTAEYTTPPQSALAHLISGNYEDDEESNKQINELLDKYAKMSKENKNQVQVYRTLVTKTERSKVGNSKE